MSTLADMLNSPTEITFRGATYRLRQPTLFEQGEFQRWLEQRAYDAIERRTYQSDAQQAADRNALNQDVAAGVYEWGGEVCAKALQTPTGIARLLATVLRDQGVTPEMARAMVDEQLRVIAALIVAKAADDPNSLRATLAALGLPENFFSDNSPTRPSTTESTTSAA